jgi:hypothetical protein
MVSRDQSALLDKTSCCCNNAGLDCRVEEGAETMSVSEIQQQKRRRIQAAFVSFIVGIIEQPQLDKLHALACREAEELTALANAPRREQERWS